MEDNSELVQQSVTDDFIVSVVATGVAADLNQGVGSSNCGSTYQEGFEIRSSPNKRASVSDIVLPPQITKISPMSTPQRPPKTPNELMRRRASLAKSTFSKTKSRLVEPPYPSDKAFPVENTHLIGSKKHVRNYPRVTVGAPIVPKSPSSTQGKEDDEDADVYKSIDLQLNQQSHKFKFLVLLEWIIFISLVGLLIASLTIRRLKDTSIWSLGLWKWCILVIVFFCGRLVTGWFITILVYLMEQKLLFKKKVLYFVYGLKNSVRVCLWLSFVLVAWILFVIHENSSSRKTKKVLHCITLGIAGCLVGAGLWLMKTILIKTLALSFHVNRFFDRIQESLFHQYVLQTLSGPPFMEMAECVAKSKSDGQLSLERRTKDEGVKEDVINVEKLHKINQEKVSAWTMERLINVIRRTKLSTIFNNLDYDEDDELGGQNKEITSEWEAKVSAVMIFNNVAKSGYKYIEEEDLLRFMKTDEVNGLFPLFEGAVETGKIKKKSLKKWVVNAYLERKSLAYSLNDTKTAVEELNKIASGVVLIVIIILWNLMVGFLSAPKY